MSNLSRCWACGKATTAGVCEGPHNDFDYQQALNDTNVIRPRNYSRATYAQRYRERAQKEREMERRIVRDAIAEVRRVREENLRLAQRNQKLEQVLAKAVELKRRVGKPVEWGRR